MSLSLIICLCFILQSYNVFSQTLDQGEWEKSSKMGAPVDFSCLYTQLSRPYYIFWYQQLPGRHPVYIRQMSYLGDEFRNETFSGGKRFTARRANDRDILEQEHDTYKGKMTLINKRSTPDDSAVYICAINHMSKKHLEFGGGNRLTLLPETHAVASAYLHKVDTDGHTACMVKESGPAVASVLLSGETVSAEPTMATGESSYGLVAVATHSASDCRVKQGNVEVFTSEEENQSGMNTDEKMNFLYLSLLGLRVLCVKTLVLSGLLTISLLNFST